MDASTRSAPRRAPDPPPRFRGAFLSGSDDLARFGEASGPFRHPLVAVARPVDEGDVSALVEWASSEGACLIPRGAGTGMPGGNVGPGVAVDLTGMRVLGPPDPTTRTVRAGVGVTGREVQDRGTESGLFFPALPSSADRCTVGGMVANNAAGARSFGHGPVRPWVEEARVVMADGSALTLRRGDPPPQALERLRAELLSKLGGGRLPWPAVAKNSSGYALDSFLPSGDALDLMVGSEGTLGIVTEVLLRLAPEPRHRALALFPVTHRRHLPDAVAMARAVDAAACEFFDARFLDLAGLRTHPLTRDIVGEHPSLVLVEVAGSREKVEEGLQTAEGFARTLGVPVRSGRSEEERARLWAVRHSASPVVAAQAARGLVSMQFIEDSVVRAAQLPAYLSGIDDILTEEGTDAVVFGHAGDGNVHVNPLVDVSRSDWRETVRRILENTVELVAGLGGTLSGEHGDGRLRGTFHPRIFGDDVADAFRDVKVSLDPRGVLNPGVIVPTDGQDPLGGITARRER